MRSDSMICKHTFLGPRVSTPPAPSLPRRAQEVRGIARKRGLMLHRHAANDGCARIASTCPPHVSEGVALDLPLVRMKFLTNR